MTSARILVGDCRETLRALAAGSVRCAISSPPYWALREYGTAPLTWPAVAYAPMPGLPAIVEVPAMRCSLGLEPTPEAYVAHLVLVYRELRRVLADDGTCWVNLGDCHATGAGSARNPGGSFGKQSGLTGERGGIPRSAPNRQPQAGLKPKDLCGLPWRVAFALQADGWWLRSDVIWHKPDVLPESVADRPTRAHEYLFLLAKRRRYYFDGRAIAEPVTCPEASTPEDMARAFGRRRATTPAPRQSAPRATGAAPTVRNRRTVWRIATSKYAGPHFAVFPRELVEPCVLAGSARGDTVLDPFGGSGTTAAVALDHGRSAVLCELSPAYAQLARERLGLFARCA